MPKWLLPGFSDPRADMFPSAVAALDWILTGPAGREIVNMSLGGGRYKGDCDAADASTQLYASAINALRDRGVTVFASAGNGGSPRRWACQGCVANAISVGAVWDADTGAAGIDFCGSPTAADQVACFSDGNSRTDVFAPGAFTTSTGLAGGVLTQQEPPRPRRWRQPVPRVCSKRTRRCLPFKSRAH